MCYRGGGQDAGGEAGELDNKQLILDQPRRELAMGDRSRSASLEEGVARRLVPRLGMSRDELIARKAHGVILRASFWQAVEMLVSPRLLKKAQMQGGARSAE